MRAKGRRASSSGKLPVSVVLLAVAAGVAVIASLIYVSASRSKVARLTKRLRSLIAEAGNADEIVAAIKELAQLGASWRPSDDEVAALSCQPSMLSALSALLDERLNGRIDFDVDAPRVSGGATAMIAACAVGNAGAVAALVAAGASPWIEDASGLNAAHVATRYGHLSCLKQLVRPKVESKRTPGDFSLFSSTRASDGATPLMLAAAENQVSEPCDTPKLRGASTAFLVQLDVILWFCALRVSADAAMTSSGVTALMAAAQRDHARVVAALLDAGADPELAAHDGRTALAVAARYNALSCVLELLARGVNPNGACAPPPRLVTATAGISLGIAPRPIDDPGAACAATPSRALRAGRGGGGGSIGDDDDPGNPDVRASGTAPRTMVASDSSPSDPTKPVVRSPVTPDLQVDFAAQDGDYVAASADLASPIVLAARRGHTEIMRELVRCGADANIRLTDGRPLLLAALDGFGALTDDAVPPAGGARALVRPEVVATLLDLGADPHARANCTCRSTVQGAEVAERTAAALLSATSDRGLARVWAEHCGKAVA